MLPPVLPPVPLLTLEDDPVARRRRRRPAVAAGEPRGATPTGPGRELEEEEEDWDWDEPLTIDAADRKMERWKVPEFVEEDRCRNCENWTGNEKGATLKP